MRAIVLRDGVVLLIAFCQATGCFPCFDPSRLGCDDTPVMAAEMEEECSANQSKLTSVELF